MASLKDLIVEGSSRFLSDAYGDNIYANKFVTNDGTSSQFLKADGSVDSNTYATTSQLPSLPLSIANGGTGATTAKAAEYNINSGIVEVSSTPNDDTQIVMKYVTPDTTNGMFYFRKISLVWDYIKSKISSVLGIGGSNGVPTAPTATAGTNTTQIATTAFVNTATSGFANDADVVHKANAETITGEKTFNAGAVVSAESQLKFETATDEGVYIEANDNSGDKVLTLGNIEDDSPVRLENVADPILGTDAANRNYANNPVLIEKTFEPYTISAADTANGYLFFLNVVPTSDNYFMPWKVKYKLFITTTESYTQGEYDCEIGSAGTTSNYSFFNRFYSTSYYPSYYHLLVFHSSSAKYANRETNPIKIGERINSARSATTLARVFKIQVYEAINCEVSFPENIEKYGDVYTDAKYGYCSVYNATSVGLQELSDSNTPNYYNYEYYTSYHIHGTDTPLYRYKLCGFDVQGRLVPITSTNQTSATIVSKIPNTVPMVVSKGIVYYATTTTVTSISTNIDTASIYRNQSSGNGGLTYTFNTANRANCNVYLVGNYDKTTGMFTLDNSETNSYYLYALNTGTESEYLAQFEEGKYYWLLGNITASYFDFLIDNPAFYFDGTKLIDITSHLVSESNQTIITYNELKNLRDNGNLIPGMQYRITDYHTTVSPLITDVRSADHQFDVIVRADDSSHLNENGYAAHHEGDEYFAACKLEAWELQYRLDNENWSRVAETLIEDDGYGYHMRKLGTVEVDGETYILWDASEYTGDYRITRAVSKDDEVGTELKGYDPETGEILDDGWSSSIASKFDVEGDGQGTILMLKDEYGNQCPYDFKSIQFKRWAVTDSQQGRDGLDGKYMGVLNNVHANISIEDDDDFIWAYTFSSDATGSEDQVDYSLDGTHFVYGNVLAMAPDAMNDLNDIVFYGEYNYGNRFGVNCYINTFGNGCYYNSFGNNCGGNSFGNSCFQNSFGNDCSYNAFGNYCYNNSFGNFFQNNSFGNYCNNNSFGNSCNSNSFGNDCYQNSFGNSCRQNSFGNSCRQNSFGNDCYQNSFGNSCRQNSFGNNCGGNSFGNYCQTITVFDGVQNCSVTGGSQSAPVKNAQILNGTAGASAQNKLTIAFAANKAYTQVAAKTTAGNLQIFNPADLVQ